MTEREEWFISVSIYCEISSLQTGFSDLLHRVAGQGLLRAKSPPSSTHVLMKTGCLSAGLSTY